MKAIYQHTMMRRKIRRMIGLRQRGRVAPAIARMRLLPLTREERQILFGTNSYPFVQSVSV